MKKALFIAMFALLAGAGYAGAQTSKVSFKLPDTINNFFGSLSGTQHEIRLVEDSARKTNCYVLITKNSNNNTTIVPPAISCVQVK